MELIDRFLMLNKFNHGLLVQKMSRYVLEILMILIYINSMLNRSRFKHAKLISKYWI